MKDQYVNRDGAATRGWRRAVLVSASLSMMFCAKAKEPEEKPDPTAVKTAAVEEGPITEWIELQGRIAPPYDRDATIAPQVPGRIVALAARVGDVVSAGQVLARLETGTLDDELRAAEASASKSEADLVFKRGVAKRSADLVAKGVASREESEGATAAAVAAESALAQDQSALQTARRRRAWSELTAPFAGVVVRVDRHIGDFVDGTSATPVLEVASADGWEIVASAASTSLQRLRTGQSATVQGISPTPGPADAADQDEAPKLPMAMVTNIARAVDQVTGAGDVRLRPLSRPANVALGAPVQVRIAVQSKPNVVLVPVDAVRLSPDGSAEVVAVENGIAHVRKIVRGLTEDGHVEVTSGLTVGSRVVVEDPIGIAEGAAVAEATEKDSKDDESKPESKPSPSPAAKK